MTDPQTPATEAGRDLMRALKLFRLPIGSDMYPPDVAALAAHVIAIEAEARADADPPIPQPPDNRECAFCGEPVFCGHCYEEDGIAHEEARWENR